jgi:hypothetical protein
LTVAMDGNFGLVRKKSSGQSLEPPKHGTRVFLSDDEVKQAVSSCDNDSKVGEGVSFLIEIHQITFRHHF